MQIKEVVLNAIIALIVIVLGVLSFTKVQENIKLKTEKQELIDTYGSEARRFKEIIDLLGYTFRKQHEILEDDQVILERATFFNENGELALPQILNGNNKLCLFISKNMCDKCVQSILETIDSRGYAKICRFFVESQSRKDFLLFDRRTLNQNFSYYGYTYKNNESDFLKASEKPVMAILNRQGQMNHVFIPIVSHPKRTEEYLNLAISFLKKTHSISSSK